MVPRGTYLILCHLLLYIQWFFISSHNLCDRFFTFHKEKERYGGREGGRDKERDAWREGESERKKDEGSKKRERERLRERNMDRDMERGIWRE